PANYWTHLLTSAIWDAQALTLDAASYIPTAKLPAISAAVNQACDAKDGVADGVLNDPRECRFDPAVLKCTEAETDSCLTASQIATMRKLYAGAQDANGMQIFPGFLPGAEVGGNGWGGWVPGG